MRTMPLEHCRRADRPSPGQPSPLLLGAGGRLEAEGEELTWLPVAQKNQVALVLSTLKMVSPGGTALKAAAVLASHGAANDETVAVWVEPGNEKVTVSEKAA